MMGAIVFYLSPWLGISVPSGLAEGAGPPWDAADFMPTTSPMVFVLAIVTAAVALAISVHEYRAKSSSRSSVV
jgi:hypothetical protein